MALVVVGVGGAGRRNHDLRWKGGIAVASMALRGGGLGGGLGRAAGFGLGLVVSMVAVELWWQELKTIS